MMEGVTIKERPILFKAEMVRAIMEGRKTQTRRVLQPPPEYRENASLPGVYGTFFHGWNLDYPPKMSTLNFGKYCPYGQVGDQLWVRETWGSADCFYRCHENDIPSVVAYKADRSGIQFDAVQPRAIPDYDLSSWNWDCVKWRPSIHMPRWASRLTLEITSVRVERVQDISVADAEAEGLKKLQGGILREFAFLWNSIHHKDGFRWEANPYVWVITFQRVEGGRDKWNQSTQLKVFYLMKRKRLGLPGGSAPTLNLQL